jgi:tRNA pseudouridine38-40 synthase
LRNIKLTIEYDGTRYNGWQTQKNAIGIQDLILNAIKQVTKEDNKLDGSGRTDAGVHALGQIASFKTECLIPVEKIPEAINKYLPKDIVINKAEIVSDNFHARYSATGKKYMYIVNNSKYRSAIHNNHEYHIDRELNYKNMKKACEYFEGTHDFKGFMSSGSSVKDTIRTIYKIQLKKREDDRIIFNFTGDGFLYNMVRIIVGTLVEVGLDKIKPEEIEEIIKSKDRNRAGKTLAAQGLYLMEVYYENRKDSFHD